MQQLKKHQPSKNLLFVSKKIKKYLVMYQVEFITRILASKYKDCIDMGKVKYWNEVLLPVYVDESFDALSPNLVKALIASESSFIVTTDRKDVPGDPRGLTQITEQTRSILSNIHSPELHDYYTMLKADELFDASANICAGVRWLFHKRHLLFNKQKRHPITWDGAIANYKSAWREDIREQNNTNAMVRFHEKYDWLMS